MVGFILTIQYTKWKQMYFLFCVNTIIPEVGLLNVKIIFYLSIPCFTHRGSLQTSAIFSERQTYSKANASS